MSFSSTSTSPTSHPAKKRFYFLDFSISQKKILAATLPLQD
jgi:hypothetical protein